MATFNFGLYYRLRFWSVLQTSKLHKLWYPSIWDTSTWSKIGAHWEHGNVFVFSNLGALWFSGLQDKGILKKRTMVWLFITLIYRIYRNTNIKSYSSSCNLIKHWGGGWHERTNSVVNSEQETKMEGVQHVYNKKDNIDAALVCEDRLREHTWTINGKFHPPLHQRVAWKSGFWSNFRTRNQNGSRSTCFQWKVWSTICEDNIDAALVCENRLREHTWTINGKFQEVDAALVET